MAQMFIATDKLWLTEDGRLVETGHIDARVLYCTPGTKIPLSEAEKYGLTATKSKAPEPEVEEEPEAVEEKQKEKPKDKKAKTKKNKKK